MTKIPTQTVTVRFTEAELVELDQLIEVYRKHYPAQRYSRSDIVRLAVYRMSEQELPKKAQTK